jgi:hypothetical protein
LAVVNLGISYLHWEMLMQGVNTHFPAYNYTIC